MFKKLSAWVSLFLLGVSLVLIIAACSGKPTRGTSATPTTDCRMIKHAAGEACVPVNPQRIVALDRTTLEQILALGQKPIAAPLMPAQPLLQPYLDGVTNVGTETGVSLERVAVLKPDLIVGLVDTVSQTYPQLSQIAPTVLVEFEHSGHWKKHLSFMGEVLGQTERVQQVLGDYSKRLEDFKSQLKQSGGKGEAGQPSQTQVSVVRLYPDNITLYTKPGFIGTILEDAGLARPPSQDLDLAATQAKGLSPIQYSVSRELFAQADADTMFLIVGNWDPKLPDALKALQADPLWSRLKAVQAGKVYQVGDYWVGSSAIAANAVLDDLFKYLIPTPKS